MVNFKAVDNKLLKICLCVCAAAGMNACDTGLYSDLDCDASYVSECIADSAYMTCNVSTSKLGIQFCQQGTLCRQTTAGATCVSKSEEGAGCTASVCMSDSILNQCGADGQYTQVDCSADGKVCKDSACVDKAVCEPSCNEDGLYVACNEDGTKADPVDCATVGEGYECINNECALPEPPACEAFCNENGLLVGCDEEGNQLEPVSCATEENPDFICQDGECKAPAPACEAFCNDDGLFVGCDEEGNQLEPVSCATEENPDFVCLDGECKAPIAVCEPYCNDDGLFVDCDEDGNELEPVNCADIDPEAPVCINGACKPEPCTENICTDGLTVKICDLETGLYAEETVSCADSDQICDRGECIDATSLVGLPCTCEGDDCYVTYTGAELKEVFSDKGSVAFSDYLAKFQDDDIVLFPNFFSESNKGCESLQEPDGLKIACFRDAALSIPEDMMRVIKEDWVNILSNYMQKKEDFSAAIVKFTDKAANFKFTGLNGYCAPAALELSAVNSHDDKNQIFKDGVFDKDGELAGRLNRGDVAVAVAAAAEIDPESETTYCPAGSSFFSYELNMKFKFLGKISFKVAFCLVNCEEDNDCREGYSCIDFTDYNGRTSAAPASKACFSRETIDNTISMKVLMGDLRNAMYDIKEPVIPEVPEIQCTEDFVPRCVAGNIYAACNVEKGLIAPQVCDSGLVCFQGDDGAECLPPEEVPEEVTPECSSSFVPRCATENIYAICDVNTLKYSPVFCEAGTVCFNGENGAECIPEEDAPEIPVNACDETSISRCATSSVYAVCNLETMKYEPAFCEKGTKCVDTADGAVCEPIEEKACEAFCNEEGLFVGCDEEGNQLDPVSCATEENPDFICLDAVCQAPEEEPSEEEGEGGEGEGEGEGK